MGRIMKRQTKMDDESSKKSTQNGHSLHDSEEKLPEIDAAVTKIEASDSEAEERADDVDNDKPLKDIETPRATVEVVNATNGGRRGRGRAAGPASGKGASLKPKKVKEMKDSGSEGRKKEIDVEEDYEVEEILEVRFKGRTREFFVKWKGWNIGDATWEPEDNLECQDLVNAFMAEERNKDVETVVSEPKTKAKKRPSKVAGVPASRRPKRTKVVVSQKNDTEPEYEVQEIIKVNFLKNGKREFLVHWKGYSEAQATWEPENNLDCKTLVKDFLAKHGSSEKAVVKPKRGGRPTTVASSKNVKNAKDSEVEEYQVKKILAVQKLEDGTREFYVQWEGYSHQDSTWEPEAHLDCDELLKAFLAKDENSKDVLKKKGRGDASSNKVAKNKTGEEEYEVEKILKVKTRGGKRSFFIKWKGYSEKEGTWEPEEHLQCKEMMKQFLAKV